MKRIVLISPPWPLFNSPSIQLGALKAFIKQRIPETEVKALHAYLSVAQALGYDLYDRISERTWLAESLYAALLYPDRTETISRFWERRASAAAFPKKPSFGALSRTIKDVSSRILDGEDWERCLLTGFSICFGQLTSSLYFVREIKQRAPSIKIVVGGSATAGDMGKGMLQTFPDLDFVVRCEGELPLLNLVKSLSDSQDSTNLSPVSGLISRDERAGSEEISQVSHLDELPIPDYGDYFRRLGCLGPEQVFLPRIPMEISRGCWWQKPLKPKGTSGCAFCNLNLQWQGYRAKSPERTIAELHALTEQHQILSVSFMDNLLPAKDQESLFKRIQGLGKDLSLFGEIRAATPRKVLAAMASAGMRQVQVGIEALSTGLLKKLNKGTTAMDNLEIMKNCETPGMPDLASNLILAFPSSNSRDVAETMANLEFAGPFRPLKGIPFWLGYGSPVWQHPGGYGIKKAGNHLFYKHFFPPEILKGLRLMIQGYQGGVRYQNHLWRPVKERLNKWRRSYLQFHESPGSDPILSYQDGGNFMIISERRSGDNDMTHRLKNTSRKIYLFCETQRSLPEILDRFPGFGEEKIMPFLRMMVDKRLMFNEEDRYLSLAVPIGGRK